jgi:hypothetical protein
MLMSGIPVGVAPHCMSTFLRYISSASAASSVSFSDLMHPTRWTTLLFQFLIYFFQTSHLLAMMHGRPQLIYVLSVVGQDTLLYSTTPCSITIYGPLSWSSSSTTTGLPQSAEHGHAWLVIPPLLSHTLELIPEIC